MTILINYIKWENILRLANNTVIFYGVENWESKFAKNSYIFITFENYFLSMLKALTRKS